MQNPKLLDEIAGRISQLAATGPARDLERNARALLGGFLSRMELVTREEFDLQREVLARTRSRLEALEARVADLEARLKRAD
ncbi:MAG: accessory factor UbiK family protein [Rhodocyclaceae bacterium]|nr:accessory factor UbiK family protein [Rhodocyclaceae bacterium]